MFVEFNCQCGHEFRTHSRNVGMPIACPNCLTQVIVPDPEMNSGELPTSEIPTGRAPRIPPPPFNAAWPIGGRPAMPATPASSANPSLQNMVNDANDKSSSQPISDKSRSNKRSDNEDNQFDSIAAEPQEALFDDDVLAELSPRRRKGKPKNDDGSKTGKRTNQKQEGGGFGHLPLIILGVVAGMLLIGSIGFFTVPILVAGLKQEKQREKKVALPQEFEKFEDADVSFRCEVPKGWEAESRGGQGNIPPSVRIEKGSLKISFRASNSGAAIQDMTQAVANHAGELPDELKPVARVHDFQREKFSHEMTGYKEIGGVERIETGWGEGRLSTFTATGSYGIKIVGIRATLLTTQYQWNVVCQCPTKRDFEANKLIFRRVIESTGR